MIDPDRSATEPDPPPTPPAMTVARWWRELAAVLVLAASFSFSIVYTNVQTYDPVLTPATGYTDTRGYIAIYRGETPAAHHRAYRLLTPWLARLVPDVPARLFTPGRPLTPDFQVACQFGLVNFVFLILTGVALHVFQRGLGFTVTQALVGALLFFSGVVVVRSGGLPMTDPGSWFFLVMGFVAIQRHRPWLLAAASLLGVLNNQNFLLLAPMTLLAPGSWRSRIRLMLGVLPGLLVLFAVRSLIDVPGGDLMSPTPERLFKYSLPSILRLLKLHLYVTVIVTFGPLWLPALYGWARCPLPLFLGRCLWFVPLVFVAILLQGAGVVRSLFLVFPVVVPLAVLGSSRWLPGFEPSPGESRQGCAEA